MSACNTNQDNMGNVMNRLHPHYTQQAHRKEIIGSYLHPVATGSDQFSWNHCTCWLPSVVSVSLMSFRRGVNMVEGGMGFGVIFTILERKAGRGCGVCAGEENMWTDL